jgi:hypothetical protein
LYLTFEYSFVSLPLSRRHPRSEPKRPSQRQAKIRRKKREVLARRRRKQRLQTAAAAALRTD